jgi:TrmH family RNA methyltransferase
VLVAESVEKPGNLGSLLRTADSAGCAALVICDPVTDLFNPNVIRASQGAVFSVPVGVASSADTIAWARAKGLRILATTPDGAQPIWDVDARGPVAIIMGSEKDGLAPAWLEAADTRVFIPQAGTSDSLNVATAAAVCLFEAVRQRRRA